MAISVKFNGRRYKAVITITAGTPIFVAGGNTPILADRLIIQMLHGSTGRGLVYDDVPIGTLPANVAAGDVPTELAAAPDALNPGGMYGDSSQAGIDLRQIAIDGTNTGDQVLVNAHLKI